MSIDRSLDLVEYITVSPGISDLTPRPHVSPAKTQPSVLPRLKGKRQASSSHDCWKCLSGCNPSGLEDQLLPSLMMVSLLFFCYTLSIVYPCYPFRMVLPSPVNLIRWRELFNVIHIYISIIFIHHYLLRFVGD